MGQVSSPKSWDPWYGPEVRRSDKSTSHPGGVGVEPDTGVQVPGPRVNPSRHGGHTFDDQKPSVWYKVVVPVVVEESRRSEEKPAWSFLSTLVSFVLPYFILFTFTTR